MTNKENIKKIIIYRSTHRGSKEMDLLLGNFVKKHINDLDNKDLKDLDYLISIEDEILSDWYYKNKENKIIINNKIFFLLKKFKM